MPPDVRSGPQTTNPGTASKLVALQATITASSIHQGSEIPPWAVGDLPECIAQRVAVDPVSGCWIWTGPLDKDGYGKGWGRGVHRIVWERLVGAVPPPLVLDHREDWGCTSRACCYPAHLKPVTTRENTLRGQGPTAVNAAKVACIHGHPFNGANTYVRPSSGQRVCRICAAGWLHHYRIRQRRGRHTELARAA